MRSFFSINVAERMKIMKKFLCLLCVLLLSLGLFSACGEPGETPATTDFASASNAGASDLSGVPDLSDVRIPDPALPEDQWSLPPVRRGAGTAKVQRLQKTLAELGAEADLAAIVQIGNWRSEQTNAGTLGETDYDAVVLKDYKTGFTGAVVIRQEGCSAVTASDSPLLTYGNTLLLFLQQSSFLSELSYVKLTFSYCVIFIPDSESVL